MIPTFDKITSSLLAVIRYAKTQGFRATAKKTVQTVINRSGVKKSASSGTQKSHSDGQESHSDGKVTPDIARTQVTPDILQIVSVVITVYNRPQHLRTAVETAIKQSSVSEVIIVDDATDLEAHPAFQKELEEIATFNRVRVVRNKSNLGLGASRNEGLKHVQTPFVCFLDDDDFFLNSSLDRRATDLVSSDIEVAGTYCDWVACTEYDGPNFEHRQKPAKRTAYVTYRALPYGSPFIASAPLVRTAVIRAVGGFDPGLRQSEDYDLWGRILSKGYVFLYTPVVGVAYRRSADGLVLSNPARQLEQMQSVRQSLMENLSPSNSRQTSHSIDDYDFAWTASRYCALVALAQGDVDVSSIPPQFIFAEGIEKILNDAFKHATARLGLKDRTTISIARSRLSSSLATSLVEWRMRLHALQNAESNDPSDASQSITAFKRHNQNQRVVLVAESPYHCAELLPLSRSLEAKGYTTLFMESPGTMQATRDLINKYSILAPFDEALVLRSAALVSMNDWGHLAALYEKIQRGGTRCIGFAKVEGVQDFEDLDTGRQRRPYQRASIVLCQGQNDQNALNSIVETHIVGSSRLEEVWGQVQTGETTGFLVNQNFTYNVLVNERQKWITDVSTTLSGRKSRFSISAHPADTTRLQDLPYSSESFNSLCHSHGVLISRFSTVFYEAACFGMPLIYHNPHREQSEKYISSCSPEYLRITRTNSELDQALQDFEGVDKAAVKTDLEIWFSQQIDLKSTSSAIRSAEVIDGAIGRL